MSFQKIKRIFYREIYSKFKPLQYAKKIGVNFGGGGLLRYTYMEGFRGEQSLG